MEIEIMIMSILKGAPLPQWNNNKRLPTSNVQKNHVACPSSGPGPRSALEMSKDSLHTYCYDIYSMKFSASLLEKCTFAEVDNIRGRSGQTA